MSRYSNYDSISMKDIIYKEPVDKTSIIIYNNKLNVEPMLLTTPVIRLKEIKENKLYLDLTESTKFYDFIKVIDELNITNCYYNAKEWFKKNLSLSLIEEYYQSPIIDNNLCLEISVDKNKKLEIDYILDTNKKYTNIHALKNNSLIKLNLKYVGIKFKGRKFFPKIEIKSIKIYESIKKSIDINSSDEEFTDDDDIF